MGTFSVISCLLTYVGPLSKVSTCGLGRPSGLFLATLIRDILLAAVSWQLTGRRVRAIGTYSASSN